MFDDVIEEKKREFEQVIGRAYRDGEFKSPEATPVTVRDIVRTIKLLEASRRQIEIIQDVRKSPRAGDAFMIPPDKVDLIEEFKQHEATIELWKEK